jgi:hypothetical protein
LRKAGSPHACGKNRPRETPEGRRIRGGNCATLRMGAVPSLKTGK